MSLLGEIINGHFNEFRAKVGIENKEQEKIFQSREKVCNSCPLKNGNTCNTNKGIHPETLDVTTDKSKKNEGYRFGCGCRLSAKIRSSDPATKCPADFWGGEFK
jgi:hypothetical protein